MAGFWPNLWDTIAAYRCAHVGHIMEYQQAAGGLFQACSHFLPPKCDNSPQPAYLLGVSIGGRRFS